MTPPGWNNPAVVQAVHSWLEGAALLFFAALVVFDVWAHIDDKRERNLEAIGLICFAIAVLAEIAAYPYGKHNDELSNLKIASLNLEAERAMERASKADERAARLEKDVENERTKRLQLAEKVTWVVPDDALIPRLSLSLKSFTGQRYTFITDLSDPERTSVSGWIMRLASAAGWRFESPMPRDRSELTLEATNIVVWVSPNAPKQVVTAARSLVPTLNRQGLPAVVLQSGWGTEPNPANPPDLIRIVVFKKGPRMSVGHDGEGFIAITWDGLPLRLRLGSGPPIATRPDISRQ